MIKLYVLKYERVYVVLHVFLISVIRTNNLSMVM